MSTKPGRLVAAGSLITLGVALTVAVAFGVASWYRSYKSMVAFHEQEILAISADQVSGGFRVPQGKHFSFVLGTPVGFYSAGSHFSGELRVSSGHEAVYKVAFDQASVTSSSWLDDHGLCGLIINFVSGQNAPLVSGQYYQIDVTTTNLVGCTIWLCYAASIAEGS